MLLLMSTIHSPPSGTSDGTGVGGVVGEGDGLRLVGPAVRVLAAVIVADVAGVGRSSRRSRREHPRTANMANRMNKLSSLIVCRLGTGMGRVDNLLVDPRG